MAVVGWARKDSLAAEQRHLGYHHLSQSWLLQELGMFPLAFKVTKPLSKSGGASLLGGPGDPDHLLGGGQVMSSQLDHLCISGAPPVVMGPAQFCL